MTLPRLRHWFRILTLFTAILLHVGEVGAHEIRPALLDIKETQSGWFEVTWKVPVRDGSPLQISPVFTNDLVLIAQPSVTKPPGARVERSSYRDQSGGFVGSRIEISGLSAHQIDVLIQVSLADGISHSAIIRPGSPTWIVPKTAGGWEVAQSYWILGVEHILGGTDHLLFVLALLILIPNHWMLIKAITAFTVAHSITLGLATLGYVKLPSGPTEAVIALSILFLAVEICRSRSGSPGLTERAPWLIAFIFGLVHGLGFAGALSEIGLPQQAIPVALLMFNIGVETGQILFVLTVVALIAVMRRLPVFWPVWGWRPVVYGIGSLAAFWTMERIGGFI